MTIHTYHVHYLVKDSKGYAWHLMIWLMNITCKLMSNAAKQQEFKSLMTKQLQEDICPVGQFYVLCE